VGAGLAGSMMALMLAKRGIAVELYELRADARIQERDEVERDK
jgi:folate-dependent tRNA-U54 methylase TrmFO/GidA